MMRVGSALYAVALLGVWSLAGCAALTPTEPYGTVMPVTRAEAAVGDSGTQHAPVVNEWEPLSLRQVIDIALERNPEIAGMTHDVEAAKARADAARGTMLPTLLVEGAFTRHLDDQRLVPARANGEVGTFSDTIAAGDLVLRVPLFTGGRLVNEARAAALLSQASGDYLGRFRNELVFNVTSVYYAILAQERLVDSHLFSQEALVSHLKRVNDLIDEQKAARVDRLRTQVRLADVRQRIVREGNTLAIQRHLLANLMGIASTTPSLQLQGALDDFTTAVPETDEAFSNALSHRPDYLAARKELEAQALRVDVARAGYAPTIHLAGAYGGRWAVHPTDRRAADGGPLRADSDEDVGRVGIGMAIPLFQGGRIQAKVGEERARLAAAQERLRKTELRIHYEVTTALLNLGSALQRVETLLVTVDQAEESLRIERETYGLGRGAIVDVLDAQAALLEAETNYNRALADVNVAHAQVELAMGEQSE